MLNSEYIQDFAACVQDLLQNETVLEMKKISQHTLGISCYDHCLYVSFLSFVFCKKHGLDARSAARGAMLHDLYLKNWDETDVGLFRRLLIHPKLALENAMRFSPSKKEQDIILHHMWPLTPVPPKSREGFVVCITDTACALSEMLGFPGAIFVTKRLEAFTSPIAENRI